MHIDTQSQSVDAFCQTHSISKAFFYKLCKEGKGPKLMKVGKRTLISSEAAKEWRETMEAQTS